ncbi:MAG TPA: hypothetical protein VNR36_04920 [Pseudolysinimonas sp.]|nr:hypothetical protein [Pseudolysinimonas sp.]
MTDITPLQILGDAEAASCDGEVCELPQHREHAIVNRRLDDDAV